MKKNIINALKNIYIPHSHFGFFMVFFVLLVVVFLVYPELFTSATINSDIQSTENTPVNIAQKGNIADVPPLDKEAYDKKILELANNPPPKFGKDGK